MLLSISILSIFLSLIIIIISNWQINKNSIFIGSFLFLMSLFSIHYHLSIVSFSLLWNTIYFNTFSPLYLVLGPLFYFYIRGLFADRFLFTKKDLLHFIPALIHLISIAKYLVLPFSKKMELVQYLNTNADHINQMPFNSFFTWQFNYAFRITTFFGYVFVCAYIIMKRYIRYKKEPKSTRSNYIFRWLFILVLSVLVISLSLTFSSTIYSQNYNSLFSIYIQYSVNVLTLGIVFINLTLLLIPEILYGKLTFRPIPSVLKKSFEVAVIKDLVFENEYFIDLAKQINQFFKEKQPYLKIDFAISDLNIVFKVPQHHIAICFRDYIGIKFIDMKTQYRIEYAKEVLLSPDHFRLTLDAIGQQSGFLSKSNFFSCFKKSTGLTPLEFQNNHKKTTVLVN
jgi:AraC-like DNA-binding protein